MSDELAMELLAKGDLDKSAILFERYHRQLYGFFLRMSYDKALSEDLCQSLFLRLIRYRTSYQTGKPVKAWLYQMARNLLLDYFREQQKGTAKFTDLEKVMKEAAQMHESDQAADQEKALHKALSLLDEEQRELLVLSKFQGMKYTALAALMETTEANIKVKVHRAIKKLRGLYFMIESE